MWRFHARRAVGGQWLDHDLPLDVTDMTWALSGPGSLRATTSPDVGRLRAADGSLLLDEWGTLLYAEQDNEIRWGGIVVRSSFSGKEWGVEAVGMTSYPHGIPYDGPLYQPGTLLGAPMAGHVQWDAGEVVASLWAHVQSHPDGGLGITVDSPIMALRTPPTSERYALAWWDAKDCGAEIDTLAKATPFDYVESHAWASPTSDAVVSKVTLGYPRLGTRRTDLAFEQGVNVVELVTPTRNGDTFANEAIGIGAGEGKATVRASVPTRDGRLRRPIVYTDKGLSSAATLSALARRELMTHRNLLEISEITVEDHPHARIASWALGDDIAVRADIPWLGDVELSCRITGWSYVSATRAKLSLERSDSYTYGRPPS